MLMKTKNILLLILILSSCSGNTLTGYCFITKAVYNAEKSRISAELKVSGKVEPGMDIGSGEVNGIIRIIDNDQIISFKSKSGKFTELSVGNKKLAINDSAEYLVCLLNCFESLDYKIYDENEVKELVLAIKACELGPKATYMKGQTRFLTVENTDFERY